MSIVRGWVIEVERTARTNGIYVFDHWATLPFLKFICNVAKTVATVVTSLLPHEQQLSIVSRIYSIFKNIIQNE